MVFERFTERARHVVVLAQEEAGRLDHNHIGTEHLLLGLLREEAGVAARALEAMGISLQSVRLQVEEIIGEGLSPRGGHIPFTPRAKKVLELSLREALELGHNYIGTEHILLGLVRLGEGVAAQVLETLNADLGRVRQEVVAQLSGRRTAAAEEGERQPAGEVLQEASLYDATPAGPEWPACPRCTAPLEETARYRVLDVPAEDEGDTRAVPTAFCSKCGVWLGTIG